jgi:hypothetical protein
MREPERTEVYWSNEERELARKLFAEHLRAGGYPADQPSDFGFMAYVDRCVWYSRARSQINSDPARFN